MRRIDDWQTVSTPVGALGVRSNHRLIPNRCRNRSEFESFPARPEHPDFRVHAHPATSKSAKCFRKTPGQALGPPSPEKLWPGLARKAGPPVCADYGDLQACSDARPGVGPADPFFGESPIESPLLIRALHHLYQTRWSATAGESRRPEKPSGMRANPRAVL